MPRGQTPALTPKQAERYREVVRLRAIGLKFEEIAERVGYSSRSGAKEAYDRALALYGRESVENLRELEGERLEQLWRQTFARVLQNPRTVSEFVSLVNAAVRISNSRASLFGLDAPKQVNVSGPEGGPIETDVGQILVERLRALGAGAELDEVIDVETVDGE